MTEDQAAHKAAYVAQTGNCPYSGEKISFCKSSDICDCFEFPEYDVVVAGEVTATIEDNRRHPERAKPRPERVTLRTDGCPAFNLAADGPWNRCQRDPDHLPPHRDYFDREWT